MFKGRGRHVRRARWVGPVFALDAVRLHWEGKRELEAAVMAQLAEYAQDGAR